MDKDIKTLKNWILESKTIVFFGGAGVSTLSGIPDFRSKDGLYNQKYDYPPEEILSHHFFTLYPDIFYKFYKEKMNCLESMPNIVHLKLKELEEDGKLKAIITQNIDGLHQKAGSKKVYELHGSIYRNYCVKCGKFYDAKYVFSSKEIPKCSCGGLIKPDVVLYDEALNSEILTESLKEIASCDLLIVGGSSLTVYPASGLINYFQGKHLVIINKMKTSFDNKADLVINKDLGEVFKNI